jgi:hypothetical protein
MGGGGGVIKCLKIKKTWVNLVEIIVVLTYMKEILLD